MSDERICQHCGKRPGTNVWVAEGGALAYVHGFAEAWCDLCVAQAQLVHAEKMAAMIPALKDRLIDVLRTLPPGKDT